MLESVERVEWKMPQAFFKIYRTKKIDEKRLKIIDVKFLKIIFSFFTHLSFAVKFLPFSISELAAIIKSFFCATSCNEHKKGAQNEFST